MKYPATKLYPRSGSYAWARVSTTSGSETAKVKAHNAAPLARLTMLI